MFRVDRNQNRLSRLTQKRFADLALRERDHLQEWLVHQPDALGEDLLIIQKEFDGFDETRERLDLLALDKQGNLVVIENKLDNSGRDVTWQALKYTAYVSGLNRGQIVDIHQQYLDRYCGGGSASARICEFMGVEELEETVLNPGNGQRMIFIAANFRREVTATVLWLLGRGIRAQCFKVVPYSFGEELFIDMQQIIPPPEAADYMIGISSKEVEETASLETQKRRHDIRLRFWMQILQKLREDGVTLFAGISPTQQNWVTAGSGVSGFPYVLAFSQREARVELGLSRKNTVENKWAFDQLHAAKEAIEAAFGAPLDWRRHDDQIQSRIVFAKSFDGFNDTDWPAMAEWMSQNIRNMQATFKDHLAKMGRQIRTLDEEPK